MSESDSKYSGCKCCSSQSCGNAHNDGHGNHSHKEEGNTLWIWPGVSLIMLLAGIIMEYSGHPVFFHQNNWIELAWYLLAFIPVGISVIKEAIEGLLARDYFNEFTLMSIASIGAFCIGEYPEGVAVMLFYCIGELLQDKAVDRVKENINDLLSLKENKVAIICDEEHSEVSPEEVGIGDYIYVKPGERVMLDSVLQSGEASFDTSALTGESLPKLISSGEEVLAGMIPLSVPVTLKVVRKYEDSTLSKIVKLVSEAADKKARPVKFITRFARIYTPIVILLAIALVALPAVVACFNPSFHYDFSEWLYRGLVFLVISCPCALVISVPLGYFVGIGAASRRGILVKGGNYLDIVRHLNTIAFDKTGTLTTGKLKVKYVRSETLPDYSLLSIMASAESGSHHPLANTLVSYVKNLNLDFPKANDIKEMSGYGIKGRIGDDTVVIGNLRLLRHEGITYPANLEGIKDTVIFCAINGKYEGYVSFTDDLKPDAKDAIKALKGKGVKNIVMLSGDNQAKVNDTAIVLGITEASGNLLPNDKADFIRSLASDKKNVVAYVGDGINDAPVLALSNVGIAMGGLGADIAVENADVIIQTDQLSKIPELIKISKITHAIIVENIVFAIIIKVAVLVLGSLGHISLWAAVFADVGVSLLAILNSLRILYKFTTGCSHSSPE